MDVLLGFSTPFGAKQYLRAPIGSKATAPFFDMCMTKILDAAGLLRKGVEMVLDDHAGFASVVYDENPAGRSHYHLLQRYLKMCSEHRLQLSPKKFTLFNKEADIAGLLHQEGGLRPNPPRYQAVVDQSDPQTVGDVYNCMSAVGWSRSFIPNFAVIEQPVWSFVMTITPSHHHHTSHTHRHYHHPTHPSPSPHRITPCVCVCVCVGGGDGDDGGNGDGGEGNGDESVCGDGG